MKSVQRRNNSHYSGTKDIFAYCPEDGVIPEEYTGSRPPLAISICYQQVNAILKTRSLISSPNYYKNRKARNILWFTSTAGALIGFKILPDISNLWWLCLLFLLVQFEIFANLIKYKDKAEDDFIRTIPERSKPESQPAANYDQDDIFN